MLIILQQRHAIKGSQQVDEIVSAEIPPHPDSIYDPDAALLQQKRAQAETLLALVLKNGTWSMREGQTKRPVHV